MSVLMWCVSPIISTMEEIGPGVLTGQHLAPCRHRSNSRPAGWRGESPQHAGGGAGEDESDPEPERKLGEARAGVVRLNGGAIYSLTAPRRAPRSTTPSG